MVSAPVVTYVILALFPCSSKPLGNPPSNLSLLDSVFAPTFLLKRYSAVRYRSTFYCLGLTSYITFLLCFAHRPHVYVLYHHASLHVLCCSWVLNIMTALKKLILNLSTKRRPFYRIVFPCGNLMLLPIQLTPHQYWKKWTIDNNHEILAHRRVDHVHYVQTSCTRTVVWYSTIWARWPVGGL